MVMPKRIAFITTETNGLHKENKFNVTIKNLYNWARLIKLQYIIGYRDSDTKKFIVEKKVKKLIKPHHFLVPDNVSKINGLTQKKLEKDGADIKDVLTQFRKDMGNVRVIVSHSLPFHLKVLQAEMLRWVIVLDFNNYTLIDTINFFHDLEYPKLKDLTKHVLKKEFNKSRSYNLIIIKKIFLELYNQFEKSINKKKKIDVKTI